MANETNAKRMSMIVERRRDETDEVLVAQVLDDEPRIGDRLGHDRARELTLGDLRREPLRRTFGQTQRERECGL